MGVNAARTGVEIEYRVDNDRCGAPRITNEIADRASGLVEKAADLGRATLLHSPDVVRISSDLHFLHGRSGTPRLPRSENETICAGWMFLLRCSPSPFSRSVP